MGVAGTKEGFPEEQARKIQEDGEEFSVGETWSGWRVRTLKGGMKQNGMFGCSVIIRTFPGCQGCVDWAGGGGIWGSSFNGQVLEWSWFIFLYRERVPLSSIKQEAISSGAPVLLCLGRNAGVRVSQSSTAYQCGVLRKLWNPSKLQSPHL